MYNKRGYYHSCHSNANKFRGHREHPLKKVWRENHNARFNYPPANVKELDESYELHLFVPGYEKSDFIISLTDQVLSIAVENKQQSEGNWKRQEYIAKGFVRRFELNEKTDKSAIAASYKNGVLILNLPKLEGFETLRKDIEVD